MSEFLILIGSYVLAFLVGFTAYFIFNTSDDE